MFLLGNDYDEDASDEFLIGKAAVKVSITRAFRNLNGSS